MFILNGRIYVQYLCRIPLHILDTASQALQTYCTCISVNAYPYNQHSIAHLNLPHVHLLVLPLHLLDAHLHGVHRGLGILELLDAKVGLLHVKRLVPQSLKLALVHLLLLQHTHGALLHHVLLGGREGGGGDGDGVRLVRTCK